MTNRPSLLLVRTPAEIYAVAETMPATDPRREKIANNVSGAVVAGIGTTALAAESLAMAESPTWCALLAAAAFSTGVLGVIRYVAALEGVHQAVHSSSSIR